MASSSRHLPIARRQRMPLLTMRLHALRRGLEAHHPGPPTPVPSPTVLGAAPKGSTSTRITVVQMAQDLDSPIRRLPGFSARDRDPDGYLSSPL